MGTRSFIPLFAAVVWTMVVCCVPHCHHGNAIEFGVTDSGHHREHHHRHSGHMELTAPDPSQDVQSVRATEPDGGFQPAALPAATAFSAPAGLRLGPAPASPLHIKRIVCSFNALRAPPAGLF